MYNSHPLEVMSSTNRESSSRTDGDPEQRESRIILQDLIKFFKLQINLSE